MKIVPSGFPLGIFFLGKTGSFTIWKKKKFLCQTSAEN